MRSLDDFAMEKLGAAEARGERRALVPTERLEGARVRRGAREFVSFSCNDYLGLSQHAEVKRAAAEAVARHGAGAGASRLVTGDTPLLAELERALARLKDTEDAVVFGSGYLANIGIVPSLVGPGDLVLVDALSHACLLAGSRLSGAREIRFAHNDLGEAERLLRRHRAEHRRCLVLTDGVFSMDGDLAPVAELSRLAGAHDAWLMTDDAHGLGVLADGRGSVAAAGSPPVPLQMGTLSKALGAYGGYLCASRPVCELLRNRARSFVYTTGLPPAAAGAALAALAVVAREPALTRIPRARARAFAAAMGLPEPQSAIVPLVLGTSERALAASARLAEEGFLAAAIRPPTVPPGTARLRLAFGAAHTEEDVARLAAALARILSDPGPAR
ncbi:MAG: 8-amino-7-oxononanoate synthase [Alphaproteobacteria bacterium]|nr:8-amino-7-oxononanoate synthase [Alphaproteobacteria bacterium]